MRRVGAIGADPSDPPEVQLRRSLLVYMGVLMSLGGLGWGTMALWFDLTWPSVIPYGYVVLTALNLGVFHRTRAFEPARFFQVLISLLLPFLLQWVLGGFWPSGGVMLWAMLALVGSLTFSDSRSVMRWCSTPA